MTPQEKVYPNFNDLAYEEREKIAYYANLFNIQTLEHVLSHYKGDITPNLRRKIKAWISNLKKE